MADRDPVAELEAMRQRELAQNPYPSIVGMVAAPEGYSLMTEKHWLDILAQFREYKAIVEAARQTVHNADLTSEGAAEVNPADIVRLSKALDEHDKAREEAYRRERGLQP